MLTCIDCYWCSENKGIKMKHIGCYFGGKWKKWLAQKKLNEIAEACQDYTPFVIDKLGIKVKVELTSNIKQNTVIYKGD